jgi:hypothetical protein
MGELLGGAFWCGEGNTVGELTTFSINVAVGFFAKSIFRLQAKMASVPLQKYS